MNPPECKTCGIRTDLSDCHGNPSCTACHSHDYTSGRGVCVGTAVPDDLFGVHRVETLS